MRGIDGLVRRTEQELWRYEKEFALELQGLEGLTSDFDFEGKIRALALRLAALRAVRGKELIRKEPVPAVNDSKRDSSLASMRQKALFVKEVCLWET